MLGFSLAVNDAKRNSQTGQWEDYVNFFDCTVFGKRANSLSKVLSKGMLVCVDGKLHYNSWEREGQKRSKITITVDNVEIMQKRDNPYHTEGTGPYYDPVAVQEVMEPQQPQYYGSYEDIPF